MYLVIRAVICASVLSTFNCLWLTKFMGRPYTFCLSSRRYNYSVGPTYLLTNYLLWGLYKTPPLLIILNLNIDAQPSSMDPLNDEIFNQGPKSPCKTFSLISYPKYKMRVKTVNPNNNKSLAYGTNTWWPAVKNNLPPISFDYCY